MGGGASGYEQQEDVSPETLETKVDPHQTIDAVLTEIGVAFSPTSSSREQLLAVFNMVRLRPGARDDMHHKRLETIAPHDYRDAQEQIDYAEKITPRIQKQLRQKSRDANGAVQQIKIKPPWARVKEARIFVKGDTFGIVHELPDGTVATPYDTLQRFLYLIALGEQTEAYKATGLEPGRYKIEFRIRERDVPVFLKFESGVSDAVIEHRLETDIGEVFLQPINEKAYLSCMRGNYGDSPSTVQFRVPGTNKYVDCELSVDEELGIKSNITFIYEKGGKVVEEEEED